MFAGIRAPSTPGTFLRAFTRGHALQLHAAHRRFLGALAARALLLPGSGETAFIEVDSPRKRVCGRTKQGAEYGRFKQPHLPGMHRQGDVRRPGQNRSRDRQQPFWADVKVAVWQNVP